MLKKMNKKTIASIVLLSLVLILALSFMLRASANREVTLTTNYPAPYGNYKDIYATDLTFNGASAPATPGTGKGRIYFNSSENKFKVSEGGAYVDLLGGSSPWTEASPNIYNTNLDYNVGVGTATPNCRFQVRDLINFGTGTFLGYQAGNVNTGTNKNHTAVGYQALYSSTTDTYGGGSTAVGYQASRTAVDYGGANTAVGYQALYSSTTGGSNIALGYQALYSNTTGAANAAVGYQSLYSNNTGEWNTAMGASTLYSNTTGNTNVALGKDALYSNTTGANNTAVGYTALGGGTTSNTTAVGVSALYYNNATDNTAMGRDALYSNTTGANNTAVGYTALRSNTTGNYCTAVGYYALRSNTTGTANTAVGYYALAPNTTGSNNTAVGFNAMNNTDGTNPIIGSIGSHNTAVGVDSFLVYRTNIGSYNTLVGKKTLFSWSGANNDSNNNCVLGTYAGQECTGNNNILIGYGVGQSLSGNGNVRIGSYTPSWSPLAMEGTTVIASGSNNILIGNNIDAPDSAGSNQLSIGNIIFATGVDGTRTKISSGGVSIGTHNPEDYKLYVAGSAYSDKTYFNVSWQSSDIRFKKNISAMNNPLDKVLKLMGVIFEWKTKEYKKKGFPKGKHYGVIAQEIEKILPEVVTANAKGEKSVAYSEIIPVLIEAVKEQQKQITEQQKQKKELKEQIEELKQRIDAMEKTIKAEKR